LDWANAPEQASATEMAIIFDFMGHLEFERIVD
jgi:hypothetical protein